MGVVKGVSGPMCVLKRTLASTDFWEPVTVQALIELRSPPDHIVPVLSIVTFNQIWVFGLKR